MELLDQPLAKLAQRIAGATRVFHEHQLDFCCGGKHTLRDAAAARGVDADTVAAQLAKLAEMPAGDERDWSTAPTAELIDHILTRFHDVHREQLPELIRLARRVEQVHGDREDCPHGLADHLEFMFQELESHMQKEEQILFPMLAAGRGMMAGGPIQVMRMEHDEHGESLRRLAELTHDITAPRGACNTWRALYLGLRTLREDLMEHIHLENNILFENAGRAAV
ncbi:iron-sulfur cluster repair protein YtfE [Chitiniphilus eburneus]|uniref:Iron-sulfur cluster repair protein YtfE n=1 Tax=Chitiniphilus eburneus TaxID=2571148 RepID=A0A4U0PEY7_9NEIS|nr:iron-sulfur cluster repair protein YtfE [Chitiniphilus eburneus]TJZ66393.1 iron-sulfur cluster repair protein YtfE [Chitiniphilus eburneus]